MATDATVATTAALLPRLPLQPAPLLQLPATDPHIFQKQNLMFIGLLLIVANPLQLMLRSKHVVLSDNRLPCQWRLSAKRQCLHRH